MNPETRYSAHWIVGQQGTGKTTLLLHMLASDLQKDAAIIILDAKGDLSSAIRHLSLGDRLIILDPTQPFAINPLDVSGTNITHATDGLLYIFGALLDATVTPMQEAFLRPLLRAVITAHPNPTLATLQQLINQKKGPKDQFTNLAPDLRDFFDLEWEDYAATRNNLKWRMRLLLENDLIRGIFSAPRSRFRLSDAMDTGKIVVIDNSQAITGKLGSSFLGRYIISQVWDAATARATRHQDNKRPVYLYIDEAHLVIDEKIAAIIDECRSQRIALILAHQRSKQIGNTNVLNALENCAIKMANVDAEADYFSGLLHIPEDRINQLPRGHFAMHVRGEGSSIVEIPNAPLPFRNMTDLEETQLRERMRTLYGPETHKPLKAESPSTELSQPATEATGGLCPPSIPRPDSPPPPKPGETDSATDW